MDTKDYKSNTCYLQEAYLPYKDSYRLRGKEWKKAFHTNGNQKQAEVAILISDEIDLKQK